MFPNNLIFYGDGLLAPSQIPKLEDRPLSALRVGILLTKKGAYFLTI
jgi:hypothetical protein